MNEGLDFKPSCRRPVKWSDVSSPSALLGEMVKFVPNFCYCAVDQERQEKAVFKWKWAVSGSSALLGSEMVKVAPNFCYCAVDQEKAVFKWKRAVSGPSALLGQPGTLMGGVGTRMLGISNLLAGPKWQNLPRIFVIVL